VRLRCRSFGRLAGGILALALAGASGGCSYQLDSLGAKSGDDVETTGSLRHSMSRQASTLPPENDLIVAWAAVSELLSKGGKDTSMPWENPRTGARGTITPIASAYSQDGLTCHDFLASYVRDGSESWLQGEACRAQQGRWKVRNLKPWQRT
jgi:surface antigen